MLQRSSLPPPPSFRFGTNLYSSWLSWMSQILGWQPFCPREPPTRNSMPAPFSHDFHRQSNYDIRKRELLMVKLALNEWHHWLEGTKLPFLAFLVWNDHKNLEYIISAKRLNSCHAQGALFFTRFNFPMCYHPGSRSTNSDTLS